MILRALFGILLALLLIPREPDVGLGRPGARTVHLLQNIEKFTRRLRIAIEPQLAVPENSKPKSPEVSIWTIRVEVFAKGAKRGNS